jgi:hypothetical protein
MNMRLTMLSFVVLVALPLSANAQAIEDLSEALSVVAVTTPTQPGITYIPHARMMTAVYRWYPGRYNAKDGFCMGNYSLLGYAAGNVAFEFLHRGPQSLLSRVHLNNGGGVPDPGTNP